MALQNHCIDCDQPINSRATRCNPCQGIAKSKRPKIPGVDYEHKLCPQCGSLMFRYAKVCRSCTGNAKLPPDVKKEHEEESARKTYRKYRDDRLRRNKEYYDQNAERLRQYRKNYYQEHADEIIAKEKQRRLDNLEKERADDLEYNRKRSQTPEYKAYQKAYQEKNADYIRIQSAEYRKANKERIRERFRNYYHTEKGHAYFMRMRERHQDSPLLKENKYRLLWIEYRPCGVCGSYDRREVDHILEQSKGGSDEIENLHIRCFIHHRKAGVGRHSTWKEGD